MLLSVLSLQISRTCQNIWVMAWLKCFCSLCWWTVVACFVSYGWWRALFHTADLVLCFLRLIEFSRVLYSIRLIVCCIANGWLKWCGLLNFTATAIESDEIVFSEDPTPRHSFARYMLSRVPSVCACMHYQVLLPQLACSYVFKFWKSNV